MVSVIYFIACLIFLIATALSFKANVPYREAINSAVDTGDGMKTPERMIPYYDADYLNLFIPRAKQQQTSFEKTALDLYKRPALLWIDIGFAVFCAGFAAFFWLGLLSIFPQPVWLRNLMTFCLVMSVCYGAIDVAEDLWLVKLFSQDRKVSPAEGGVACLLTETKIATISLSIVGGFLFKALDLTFSRSTNSERAHANEEGKNQSR